MPAALDNAFRGRGERAGTRGPPERGGGQRHPASRTRRLRLPRHRASGCSAPRLRLQRCSRLRLQGFAPTAAKTPRLRLRRVDLIAASNATAHHAKGRREQRAKPVDSQLTRPIAERSHASRGECHRAPCYISRGVSHSHCRTGGREGRKGEWWVHRRRLWTARGTKGTRRPSCGIDSKRGGEKVAGRRPRRAESEGCRSLDNFRQPLLPSRAVQRSGLGDHSRGVAVAFESR